MICRKHSKALWSLNVPEKDGLFSKVLDKDTLVFSIIDHFKAGLEVI